MNYSRFKRHFLAFCIFLSYPFASSSAGAEQDARIKKVALQIYFYDDIAIAKSAEDLFQNMFAKLRPDITYRRISIKSSFLGRRKNEISAELREKMATVLGPNERLAFLLIDTHGGTEKSNSGSQVTSLGHVGKIYESGVDPDFNEVFTSVKDKAEPDLQVILNSCSTFCGGEESAAKRGKAVLDFFGASRGGIYGSDVAEFSQSFSHAEYVKLRYFLPNLKTFLMLTVATSVIISPFIGFATLGVVKDQLHSSHSLFDAMTIVFANTAFVSGIVGTGLGALTTLLKPFFQFTGSRLFFNRGYYFALKNGRLAVGQKVIKYKEVKNMISRAAPMLSCERLFSH